jgi:hypothetical protein
VTLAIASGPSGAVLGGTTTVAAVNGVATFTNLTLNLAGTYTLKATGGTLTPNVSNKFVISPANVTAQLALASGPVEQTSTGSFKQTLTITNTSAATLLGPLALVLEGLPTGVTLTNSTGSYNGSPYVNVVTTSLVPDGKVQITLLFSVPDNKSSEVSYTSEALEGI